MNEIHHCYVVLQDFGPAGGGWGPAAYALLGSGDPPRPVLYTGNKEFTIEGLKLIAQTLHETTGLATKLVRYMAHVEVVSYEATRKEHGNDEAGEGLSPG